jgi:predicted transcriptional regulator
MASPDSVPNRVQQKLAGGDCLWSMTWRVSAYAFNIGPVSDELKAAWAEMKQRIERSGLSQEDIASAATVSQPAVSRVLRECPRRSGRAFRRLCDYASTLSGSTSGGALSQEAERTILSAVRDVWNGTPEHARALAAMIRAAGAIARATMR